MSTPLLKSETLQKIVGGAFQHVRTYGGGGEMIKSARAAVVQDLRSDLKCLHMQR
jgi:hypothetical protein